MVETVPWRASSGEIRTTDVELEPPTSLLDYFSCVYSMYLEFPCIKPSVDIHVPKSSKPFALLSFGKKQRQIFDSRNCSLYRYNLLTFLDLNINHIQQIYYRTLLYQ